MNDRRPKLARAATVGALALTCCAWSVAARAEEKKAPEPLEAALVGVRNSIINASVKLKNDVLGIGEGQEAGPPTPGRSCCSGNLKYIEETLRETARILETFDRCYEEAGNTDMVLLARVTRMDLAAFAQTLAPFADARTKRDAQAALQALSRAYNQLRDTAVGLGVCGDVARPATPPPAPPAPQPARRE